MKLADGWHLKAIAEIGKVVTGSTPSTSDPNMYGGDIPFVTPGDLGVRRDIATSERTLSIKGAANARVVPAGSTLVTCIGSTIGKSGFAATALATNQQINAVIPDPSHEPAFVYYQLEALAETFRLLAGTQAVPLLNKSAFSSVKITIPSSKSEQRSIAAILSTWDQAIATTERLLSNSRTQWNALLGITLHLPSANPDASAPSDNGGFPASVQPGIPTLPPAPAGWRRVQLRDHLREVRRPVALKDDESYTLVTVKRSRGGVALREVLRGNKVKTPTQFHVRAGDFLISKRQIVHGACGIVPPELDGAVVSNEYAVLNTDGEIDLRFLRHLSETRYFQQTCFHSSIGVHVEKMIFKTDHWLNWPFNIPPLEQQRRISDILETAGRERVELTKQVDALKREKAALMSQLLTGKRRVKLPEAETEAQP